MKQTSSRTMRYASKILNATYGFMLRRGYEVVSIGEFELGWQALLKKQRVFARIINSRGEEEILFQTGLQPPDEFFDIGSVIYAATGEKVPPWKSSNPKVIQQYLDRIESYLEAEYGKGPDGLRAAQKEYSAAYSQPEIVFPQQDAAGSPPEQKIIPILYYPLMAVVVLLLFGALTTLYMVLFDRLFTAFSLDSERYILVTGILSLILAIGTILLFRIWRRKG